MESQGVGQILHFSLRQECKNRLGNKFFRTLPKKFLPQELESHDFLAFLPPGKFFLQPIVLAENGKHLFGHTFEIYLIEQIENRIRASIYAGDSKRFVRYLWFSRIADKTYLVK